MACRRLRRCDEAVAHRCREGEEGWPRRSAAKAKRQGCCSLTRGPYQWQCQGQQQGELRRPDRYLNDRYRYRCQPR